MTGRTCYAPEAIDTEIAINLGYNPETKRGSFTPLRVATLRGMYEDAKKHALDTSNPAEAAKEIAEFRNGLRTTNEAAMRNSGSSVVEDYRKLKAEFTAEEQYDRVAMIVNMVSKLLDSIQKCNPGLSRQAILQGYVEDGKNKGGQFEIFNAIYDTLLEYHSAYMSDKYGQYREHADKIAKVLDNWGALVTYARVKLRDTEGVKLGNKDDFAAEVTFDNMNDDSISEFFNLDESTREAYQETNDRKSAFGNIGSKVRAIISSLPMKYRDNSDHIVEERDDLGFPRMMDPVLIHQQLLDILSGVQSSEQMMTILGREVRNFPWLDSLVKYLKANPQDVSAFFVDFKKNSQKILTTSIENKRGVRKYKTMILNKLRDKLSPVFFLNVSVGNTLSANSVYDENGNINWVNLRAIRNRIYNTLHDFSETPNEGKSGNNVLTTLSSYGKKDRKVAFFKMTSREKRVFLVDTSRALGLDMTMDAAASLLVPKRSKDLYKYINALYDIVEYGIDSSFRDSEKRKAFLNTKDEELQSVLGNVAYKSIVTNRGNGHKFKEKITKLNGIIANSRDALRIDNKVTLQDAKGKSATMFLHVNPSYMGDKLELIMGYINEDDKEGLKKYLEANFLKSSYFMRDGKILNKWIEELYTACTSNKGNLSTTFANIFDYARFWGMTDSTSSNLNFEDFTSKQHAIDMLLQYSSDSELSGRSDTALYPVFILGDSGISKYIRQRRYSTEEILDGLYNVYLQELQRKKLVVATNEYLEKKGQQDHSYTITNDGEVKVVEGRGYKPISNFSKTANKFAMLPFLNEPEYALPENPTEEEVKSVIRRYMDNACKDFKAKLEDLGVLETMNQVELDKDNKRKTVTRYKHINQVVGNKNIDDVLQDYYWNTKFATIQQLQLMTIDVSFYESTKDLQKRYKEIHAPGTILDVYAVDRNGQLYSQDATETALYFDDISLNAEDTDPEFMAAILYNYIDRKKPGNESVTFEMIQERIKNGLFAKDDKGKLSKESTDYIRHLTGKNINVYLAYTKNTLTDGQGYRSLTSYRKVLGMAGQWTNEMENAYEAIMNLRAKYGKNPIPAEDLQTISQYAVIFRPIKPYMFTHEHLAVSDNDEQLIPVQHKYAEAVLIPELLPQGSKLRDIAYYMEENNIDLLGSTKICKVGCFGSTKIDHLEDYDEEMKKQFGENYVPTNTDRMNYALSQGFVHRLSYSDYRIQTNVPDHVYSARLFGTQIRKLIMNKVIKYDKNGKIIEDYRYEKYIGGKKVNLGGNIGTVRLTGRNLNALYNGLVVANELDSYQKFEKAVSDPETVSDRLIQGVIGNSRESLDNILAYGIEDGEFSIPLFEGGLEHDSAAMLFSIYKKLVNKQTINGGSGVQVSALGIKDYSEDGGLHFVYSADGKNIEQIECEIPFNLSYKDANGNTVDLKFEDYCNEDGTLKMDGDTPLLEKEFPGITNIVAYRIPTERAYSMLNLKVVRFSRKEAGGTIKVPLQCTTISGFDFDIDKLYFMRKEFIEKRHKKTKRVTAFGDLVKDALHASGLLTKEDEEGDRFEEYDFSKPPIKNTRAARNNLLLHLIQERLKDPETFIERTTPGGFPNSSKSARVMRELQFGDLNEITEGSLINWDALDARVSDRSSKDPEPNYDPSDPLTIITYNQQNQVAGKLIGIFANHNTNHAFASLMKRFRIAEGSEIEFAGHTAAEGYGCDLLHGPEGVDVDLNLAEFLAASVDAVKDPVLNFLNFNTLTADSGALLARLGYNTTEIGLLFNQPIIKEVCECAFNEGLRLEDAIRDVSAKYKKALNISDMPAVTQEQVTVDTLASNIINHRKNADAFLSSDRNKMNQLQVLSLFTQISSLASEVSQFVTSTKFTASNAVGSTFGDMYSQQMKVSNYIASLQKEESKLDIELTDYPIPDNLPIKNTDIDSMTPEEYAESQAYNPFAYEQAMYDLNRKALKCLSKYFPYETEMYKNTRERVRRLTRSKYLDGDTINSVHRDLMTYLLSQQELSDFNGDLPKVTKEHGEMTCREYYTRYFAEDLYNYLQNFPNLKQQPIFKYLAFEVDEKDEGRISMNIEGVGGLAPYQKEEIKDSWAQLLKEQGGDLIARDLFLYNFYKLGFDFSPISFMNLVPVEVKQNIKVPSEDNPNRTYVDFLNEVLRGEYDISYDEFAKQYILNHTNNTKLVYYAKGNEVKKVLQDLVMQNSIVQPRFTLDVSGGNKVKNAFVIDFDADHKLTTFVPAIVYEDVLYVANSQGPSFNVSTGSSIEYVRADALGSTTSKAYGYSSTTSHTPVEITTPDEASTSPEIDEGGQEISNNPLREEVIQEIAEEIAKAYNNAASFDENGNPWTAKSVRETLNLDSFADEELQANVDAIRKACRKDGIIMMDEHGDMLQGC